MKYLIDTDWTIQTLTGNTQAVTVLEKLKPIDVAMSLVSIGEIYEGAFSYADPQAHLKIFRQFLSSFTLLNLNEPIMQRFAEIRSFLRRRGEIISDFDILIGATALHHGLTLLTYNTRHFKRIPDLQFYPPTA